MMGDVPNGPNKRAGERGPNVNPGRERGRFADSITARKEFLRVYAATGSIAEGSGFVGVTKECVYRYRNLNPTFARLMEKVRRKFRQAVEVEVHRRGVKGWMEPVFGKGGQVGEVRRFSDRMLELLAKRNIGGYTDRLEVEQSGAVAQLGLDDLRSLSKEGRDSLRKVLEELGAKHGTALPSAEEGG